MKEKVIVLVVLFLMVIACSPLPPVEVAVVEPILESTPEPLVPSPEPREEPVITEEAPEITEEVSEPEVESQELSYDLSVENAHPLDFDRKGPYFHTIFKTTSANGLSFGQPAEVVFEHTSVPDVLRLSDGKIALYAVDGAGRSRSGLIVAVSNDDGNSWNTGSLQFTSAAGHTGLADPEVVLLPDGTVRMYYVIFPQPNVHTGNNQIWSAVSRDGIHFVEEEGIRFTYERLTDPDVVKIGPKWFIYFSQGPRLVAASSVDGNTFTLEKTIREQGSVSNTVPLGNTQWRQYYCNEGIKSAVSSDGMNWRDESGTRITADAGTMVCDPAPLKVDGSWVLFYKVSPGES